MAAQKNFTKFVKFFWAATGPGWPEGSPAGLAWEACWLAAGVASAAAGGAGREGDAMRAARGVNTTACKRPFSLGCVPHTDGGVVRDLIYVPQQWWHATLNVQESVGFAQQLGGRRGLFEHQVR